MATKTLITRIKNKVDTYANWEGTTGLLDGEIAIVRVTTEEVTPAGDVVKVPALLMKVGDGTSTFDALPWLSAKASDVYDWAKTQDPSNVTVKYNKGTEEAPNWQSSTLANILKDLEVAETAIEGLKSEVSEVLGSLSVDPKDATANGVVQGITYNSGNGKFTVTYGTVATADIANSAVTTDKIKDANVTTAKIADANVTTAKIEDGAVTNAKLGTDISASKIKVDSSTTLPTKLSAIDSEIAKKMDTHDHPYLPDTTKYAGSSSAGGAADKVANKITVKLNNGSTEGTNLFTFDGSVAKTINITPSAIGASASGHTHGDLYYTETEINSKISELNTAIDGKAASGHTHDDRYYTETEVDDKIAAAVTSVLKYKGTIANTSALPTSGNATGDVWNITNAGTVNSGKDTLNVNPGDNVAWNGTNWDVLAGTVDLTNYFDKTEVNAKLDEKVDKATYDNHTHKYAGSSSAGGAANSVKGTLSFSTAGDGVTDSFNGSASRKISYNSVGAAAASHTHTTADITDFAHNHDDLYYTETEVNALLAEKSGTGHSHRITVTASDDDVVVLTGSNESKDANVKFTATHADSGVTAGTYKSVTVDAKGHVTAGTNPTTISGYGITDAYTKDEVNSELAKKAASSHAHGSITTDGKLGTASRVVVTDSSKNVTVSSITTTELGYLDGVTSNIQTQLNSKGTSNLTIGTTATTAAAGNHTHSGYEGRMSDIENNYVKVADNKMYLGNEVIIFDCGGAPTE